ncbi:MAG: dissimilatory-type sulfite reductase subunit beta [Proteobacteria bacterium]|nr:MAG: dissimilatory-type sulfite reductase subunit beta [Pseudomonadota bacterium]QKK12296.1 MAG: dissimilatory-type sulfite reductase subunit beta [Pseudomonadota bacterium]
MSQPRQPIESGVPDHMPYLHPLMKKNYGQWKWHERPRPGVLRHVAESGDEIWTVRAGTQRQLDVFTIRKLCDIADEFAEGFVRFTIRSNIEYMVSEQSKVQPLIDALTAAGFPIGGTGNSVSMISHTQGYLHCDIPGTDASGAVKALMDDLIEEFTKEEMPNRVRITTSCCEINCGGQGDIAINIQHTKPPKINHDLVANVCERPSVVARCPVAAIRPALVNGKPSLEVDERKCICCGACYPPCPPMQINDPEHTKFAIWVGGKNSNTRSKPTFHKLVASGIPNNPPRWPEVSEVVRKILSTYKQDAREWERMSEWIDRIGWPRFFELTDLPFTKYHIDDWRGSRATLNASAQIRF